MLNGYCSPPQSSSPSFVIGSACLRLSTSRPPKNTAVEIKQEKHKGFNVTVQSESVFWNELLMSYATSVFVWPCVNVRDEAEEPSYCVFLAVSCPAAEQKAIFP